jgi:phosphoribosylformylglycinamidine cyclo-ligase
MVDEREMYTTFNMGIGLALFTTTESANSILDSLKQQGEKAWIIGDVIASPRREVVLV